MNEKERNLKYNNYVESKIAKTKSFPSLINAFWTGGLICVLGQLINDGLLFYFSNISSQSAWAYTLIIVIFIASILTGFGVFDKLGCFAGAGTMVPITGFSNSVTSPALEFKNEGIIFGMCSKMFVIAGPVIVVGVVGSAIVGIIYLFV